MTIKTEKMPYEADGLSMVGLFNVDDGVVGQRPGILVFPDASGPGDVEKTSAKKLASLGYAALVCDLHGQGQKMSDYEEIMQLVGPMMKNPVPTRARAAGALGALLSRPEVDTRKIAAIGYCFGGAMALELARSGAPLSAAVGFHSVLATAFPENAKNIKGKVLVCLGAEDPFVPPDERAAFEREMREGGVDWRMHVYGGVLHSFTNPDAARFGWPDAARYDAGADRRSWSETLSLFEEVFGQTLTATATPCRS